MDFSEIVKLAESAREKMTAAQASAHAMEASGEAGGGMVEVRMNGKPEVLQVSIDPALLQRGDAALLEDLVRAACNQALATLQQSTQQSMGSMMQAAGLDLSRLGLGRDEDSPKLG